ncbi:hypothetical protein GJAV_G00159600 [Gymnothorax javanicus]|nr:hypothetical protein GJAV_G00159600 [Gymnothorax javanicus]
MTTFDQYDGNPTSYHCFLSQWSMMFKLQPSFFPAEQAKVVYAITRLTGIACDWAAACYGLVDLALQINARLRRDTWANKFVPEPHHCLPSLVIHLALLLILPPPRPINGGILTPSIPFWMFGEFLGWHPGSATGSTD